jgi:hypothetical protein
MINGYFGRSLPLFFRHAFTEYGVWPVDSGLDGGGGVDDRPRHSCFIVLLQNAKESWI